MRGGWRVATDFQQEIAKARWAEHQLALRGEEIARYRDSEPYVAVVEDEPETKTYSIVAKVEKPPGPELSLVLGDFLDNAHGTLDYLSWQLVLWSNKIPDVRTE
jgi:hypothetical protein